MRSVGDNLREKNATGLGPVACCYYKTAPMPMFEASVTSSNGKSKFGNARHGADVNACFNESNAVCCAGPQV